MTYDKGMAIVTLNIPTHLIQQHEQNILLCNGISIMNFKYFTKTNYDRADIDCIILLDESSIVETILLICKKYDFILQTIIKQLPEKINIYSIGTIGTSKTFAKKITMQYILNIKDGNLENEKTMVRTYSFYIPYSIFYLLNAYICLIRKHNIIIFHATTPVI